MTVDAKTRAARQARYERRRAAAEKIIPPGPYCWGVHATMIEEMRTDPVTGNSFGRGVVVEYPCPYWRYRGNARAYHNGFCRLLKVGDDTQGRDRNGFSRATTSLWDMVKECGINLDVENDFPEQPPFDDAPSF